LDDYDETYENFFKRKEDLLLNINKLSQLHHGEDEHLHDKLLTGAHGVIAKSSTKLVEKRQNFLAEKTAHWDDDKKQDLLNRKQEIGEKYAKRVADMFHKVKSIKH
jgi:3-oxoacyl-ACP reductase-like protein